MFVYEKKLQYPVRIANPNPKLAAVIISQYGGPYIIKLQTQKQEAGTCWCLSLVFYRLQWLDFPFSPKT